MDDHAVDAMAYAWLTMKEKEATKMIEYINLGKVEDIKTYVLAASDNAKPYVIIDFVPGGSVIPKQLTDNISEILKHPDDYVLCNTGSITKAHDEMLKLKDRIKELEEQLSDAKKESGKKICEVYTETAETFYKSADKLMSIDKMVTELKKERDYWKNLFSSVVSDFSKTLSANGVEFTVKAIDGNKWNVVIDIPELNKAKKKVENLEIKLNAAKSNEKYWRDRKEEEEDQHYYWFHTFDRAVKKAAEKGIHIGICGNDEDCNAGIVTLANIKAEELQKLSDYWKGESDAMACNYRNLKKSQEKKWSAMMQALKEKGVEVLYMGEEDGKPNIDVKIPEIDNLRKELDNLKSKTVVETRYEWKPESFTMTYTMCDGSKQTAGMDLAGDIYEKCTMGAFVCRSFGIPQCKNCKNHRYFGNTFGHCCCIPNSNHIIPGMFDMYPLTDEEAEGPACDKFEARKE